MTPEQQREQLLYLTPNIYLDTIHSRALHGPEIQAQARPANMIWGPGPARARGSCADLARARPANWIMRPGPGPARNNYVQTRPGPQNNFIFEAQARPEPAGPGPGHWPDHIGLRNSNIIISNVCVKSSMD